MLPVEWREGVALPGEIHRSQRTAQRCIEARPVAADRKRIRERRYSGSGIPGQPRDPEVVGEVGGHRSREPRLAEGHVLNVDGVIVNAVAAAENRFWAELPGGRKPGKPHQLVLPGLARCAVHTRVYRATLNHKR